MILTLTLPVRQRVHFKLATFVHQSLSGVSPSYLADDCRLVADARERRLRSTASRTCVVSRTYSTFVDRAFSAAEPRQWNSLTSHLKDADLSYNEFRRSLKKDISVRTVGPRRSVNFLTAPTRNIRTYLLTYLLTCLAAVHGSLIAKHVQNQRVRCKPISL